MCDRWLRTVINLLCPIMNPSELVPGMSELCTKVARLDIHILGVCETRWDNKGTTDFQSDDYRIIHSGGETIREGLGSISTKKEQNA